MSWQARYLRLVPAAIWIFIQISMGSFASASAPEPAELRELAKLLKVDRVVLCSDPEQSSRTHLKSETCPWCQGFSDSILPEICTYACSNRTGSTHQRTVYRLASLPGRDCCAYESRAPPAQMF